MRHREVVLYTNALAAVLGGDCYGSTYAGDGAGSFKKTMVV